MTIKCTLFIHYTHLLYFFCMFLCHIRHHQGDLTCPLLKTICCYVAINYGFYNRYVVNYKMYNCAYPGGTMFILQLKTL